MLLILLGQRRWVDVTHRDRCLENMPDVQESHCAPHTKSKNKQHIFLGCFPASMGAGGVGGGNLRGFHDDSSLSACLTFNPHSLGAMVAGNKVFELAYLRDTKAAPLKVIE